MLLVRARLLIVTLWAGSLWTIGYVVAPTLFATLSDNVLAGTIAGRLFRIEAWLSVFCALALIGLAGFAGSDQHRSARKHLLWVAVAMLACTLIGYFGMQPFMAELREAAGPGGVLLDAASRTRFGILHGVASAFYLIQSLLGITLVLKAR